MGVRDMEDRLLAGCDACSSLEMYRRLLLLIFLQSSSISASLLEK